MEKVTICKQEIAVGDQLILEIENWEVEKGLLFLGRKKLGEKFKCWAKLIAPPTPRYGVLSIGSIVIGNGCGLHTNRYWVPLSQIKNVEIVSSKEICPNDIFYLG